jgi:serine/threonine protein kinase
MFSPFLNPGDRFYKYQLLNHLGDGEFGGVWLARDHSISRDIAVKIMPSETTNINHKLQEARIGNLLEHQNLVKIHYADVVKHEGTKLVIIAMDYHQRGSIIKLVNPGNFLPLNVALRFIIDILRGLEYLHELNIFHNDIKPQNILIGSQNQGILTDYGISIQSPSGESSFNRGFYKPHVAPETLQTGQTNTLTDIYQTGLTIFRLLNGLGMINNIFQQYEENQFYCLVKEGKLIDNADYLSFIPTKVKCIINKATNVDPSKRFQSALDMRRAFERLNFPGYWTYTPTGVFVGMNESHEFRFEEIPKSEKLASFIAYKKNKSTGRETHITNFCAKNATRKYVADMKKAFMQWVVLG